MDVNTATEQAYRNGFAAGYQRAMDEYCKPAQPLPRDSNREEKFRKLMKELRHFGVGDDHAEVLRTVTGQLSWRVVMCIVHKLRRKRGVEIR